MVENSNRWESSLSNGVPAQHDLLQIEHLLRFMRFALRRKWLILRGLFSRVALGVLYCKSRAPMYASKAQMFVVKKAPLAVAGVDPRLSYTDDDVSTHIQFLNSPWLIKRAVKDRNLDSLGSFIGKADPVRAIINSLTITHEESDQVHRSDSNILRFSFRALEPDHCPFALNAIMETYQRFLEETRLHDNEGAFKLVTQKVAKVKTEITRNETQ